MNEIAKTLLLAVLRAYKWAVSPLFPPACRYVPSCSEYAMEAIDRHGAARGMLMASWRLLRCHPFTRGGFDPVPAERQPGAKFAEGEATRGARQLSAHEHRLVQ